MPADTSLTQFVHVSALNIIIVMIVLQLNSAEINKQIKLYY